MGMDFEKEFEKCKKITDKEKKIACLLPLLHKITDLQDRVNIHTFRTIDDETDPRWYPLHMIDNANAVILNISRNGANPKRFDRHYVDDKIRSLNEKWLKLQDWLEIAEKMTPEEWREEGCSEYLIKILDRLRKGK